MKTKSFYWIAPIAKSVVVSILLCLLSSNPANSQETLIARYPDGNSVQNGRLKVEVSLPETFDPQSVKFFWSVENWQISKLDGKKTSSILDNPAMYQNLGIRAFEDPLDGLVEVKFRDFGRKIELDFLSMLAVKVSANVIVKSTNLGKNSSLSTLLNFQFRQSKSDAGIVANIPDPDKFSLDINNPSPGSATSTKISLSLGSDAPTNMALDQTSFTFEKKYWVFRVSKTGVPISAAQELSPYKESKKWVSFDISASSYKLAGAIFRVVSSQVFPDLDHLTKSNLAYDLCISCMSGYPIWSYFYQDYEYKIPFKEEVKELIKFQWSTGSFSDLSSKWRNPTSTIINDNNYGYENFFFRFQRDVSKLPENAVCEADNVDLQFLRANKWTSVWSLQDYGGYAPSGGFNYRNCIDIRNNDNGQTYASSISPEYMNVADTLPYPSPELPNGSYKFRFVLKIKYLDEKNQVVGAESEEVFDSFPVMYIFTPEKPSLKVNVNYPRMVAYKSKNLVTVATSPKVNGTCQYYLFYKARMSVGTAKLQNGNSKLIVQALSMNIGNGLGTSITVVCKSKELEGTGGVVFFVTK